MSKFYITYRSKNPKQGLFKQSPNTSKYALIMRPQLNKNIKIEYNPPTYTNEINDYQLYNFTRNPYFTNLYNHAIDYTLLNFLTQAKSFLERTNFTKHKQDFYQLVRIPKKKGGFRDTYAPNQELMDLQKRALFFLDYNFKIKEHNAAHAYVKKRDGVTNANMHKYSKHFLKLDFSNFFPSITKNLLESTLYSLAEFGIINVEKNLINYESLKTYIFHTKTFLDILIEIATLDGVLPQGSPLSPKLSNLVMIPYDYEILKLCSSKELSKSKIIYTRYADDITFSSFHPINKSDSIQKIKEILPPEIKINEAKTVYLKNTNRLFITGAKINKDNDVTYGHEKTAILKREIFHMLISLKNNNKDIKLNQEILGQLSYAMRIEPNKFKLILQNYCNKFHLNPKTIYKQLTN